MNEGRAFIHWKVDPENGPYIGFNNDKLPQFARLVLAVIVTGCACFAWVALN